jgi:simple sugar transport system ATP-binding protein
VLVISQDLDELLTLCDTIAVINLGRLSRPMKVGDASIEEIGLLMGGVHGDPSATVEITEQLHAHPA